VGFQVGFVEPSRSLFKLNEPTRRKMMQKIFGLLSRADSSAPLGAKKMKEFRHFRLLPSRTGAEPKPPTGSGWNSTTSGFPSRQRT
jgi:hypothetical protein